MSDHAKGLLITALGVLAIVPDTLLIRLIDAPHMTVVFWRASLAAAVILTGVLLVHRGATPRVLRGLGRGGAVYAALVGTANVLFVLAVQLTTVANAVFILTVSPVFAALISRVVLGERLSLRMAVTIALSILAVGVIARGSLALGGEALLGDLCALGAAFGLAGALTAARASRHVSMVPAAGVAYVLTTLVALPFAAPLALAGDAWVYALILGGICVPLGTSLMALGPRYIPSAEVSLLLLLEAVFAPVLVWAVLGEDPGETTLAGGAMLIAVLAVSNLVALRRAGRGAAA